MTAPTEPNEPTEPPRPRASRVRRVARSLPVLRRVARDLDEIRAELAEARVRLRKRQERIDGLKARLLRAQKKVESHELAIASLQADVEAYRTAPAQADADLTYLFIVTYGRSGSTLLQAILNSTPGVLIRGENGGVLTHLYRFHTAVEAEKETRGTWAESPGSSYFGINRYPTDIALAQIRELVTSTLLRPTPDVRMTGFKEIRWYMGYLGEYVEFLQAVFPGARFIVNTRNIADTAKSRWWAKHDDPETAIANAEKRILAVAETLGDAAFRVRYDDYIADPKQLEPLFDWLGLPFDLERVTQAMETRYSS